MSPHACAGRMLVLLLGLLTLVQGCAAPTRRVEASNSAELIQMAETSPPPAEPPGWWDEHPVLKWTLIGVGVASFAFTVFIFGLLYSIAHTT